MDHDSRAWTNIFLQNNTFSHENTLNIKKIERYETTLYLEHNTPLLAWFYFFIVVFAVLFFLIKNYLSYQ